MKRVILWSLGLAVVVAIVGCATYVDPVTGAKTYAADPCAVAIADSVQASIETLGAPTVTVVSAFNPVAGAALGAVLAGLSLLFGLYKRWKVPLQEKTNVLGNVAKGAAVAAEAMEIVKVEGPELWAKIKPLFKRAEGKGAINPDKV